MNRKISFLTKTLSVSIVLTCQFFTLPERASAFVIQLGDNTVGLLRTGTSLGGEFSVRADTGVLSSATGLQSLGYVPGVTMGVTGVNFQSGTGFAATSSPLTSFGTFCLEKKAVIDFGGTYNAEISDGAKLGGVAGGNGMYDPISNTTAELYYSFATASLTGFDYTPGAGRAADAEQLQNAIWYLEEEHGFEFIGDLTTGVVQNEFLLGMGFLTQSDVDTSRLIDNTQFGVGVLNLGPANTFSAQDQIVLKAVPDEGVTLTLLAISVLSMAGLRAQKASRSRS